MANARIQRIDNLWAGQTPEYVVVGDEAKEGCSVLKWHKQVEKQVYGVGVVSTYDDPDFGGRKCLGRLDGNFNVVPF